MGSRRNHHYLAASSSNSLRTGNSSGELHNNSHIGLIMTDLATQGSMPQILAAQAMMATMPQVEGKTEHYHLDGVYVRSLFIPKGSLLTGKIHNYESIGILAQGTMRITNGSMAGVISAPYIVVDKPGIKRMGYAETDCTFINVMRSDAKTLEELEDELVSSTFEEYELKTQKLITGK